MQLSFVLFALVFIGGCASASKGPDKAAAIAYLAERVSPANRQEDVVSGLPDEVRGLSLETSAQTPAQPERLSPRQIQAALKNAGYYKGTIDGKIGPKTKEAVRSFQKAKGLKVDGVVGKRTARKLAEYLR